MPGEDQATLIADFVARRTWAVVGVSADPNKFGNRIFRNLRAAGYRVYGVNPHLQVVDGETVYPSLESLPEQPEVVDIVVPPAVAEQVVQDCARLVLCRVWLQPGAESAAAIGYCHQHGIAVVHNACAMVEKKHWPADPG